MSAYEAPVAPAPVRDNPLEVSARGVISSALAAACVVATIFLSHASATSPDTNSNATFFLIVGAAIRVVWLVTLILALYEVGDNPRSVLGWLAIVLCTVQLATAGVTQYAVAVSEINAY